MNKKIISIIIITSVASFLKPLILNEFKYWDFLEISTVVLANFFVLIVFTFITWGVMKIVSSLTNKKNKIPFSKLFFQSFILTIVLYSISLFGNYLNYRENEDIKTQEIIDTSRKIEEIELRSEIESVMNEFKFEYSLFDKDIQMDHRKDILNNIILNNKIALASSVKSTKELNDADEYYNWIKSTNSNYISEITNKLNYFKDKTTNSILINEIDDLLNTIQKLELKLNSFYHYEMNLIQEMRSMISLKESCKHEITNNKIYFFDSKCLNEWLSFEEKLNKMVNEFNDLNKNAV